MNLTQRQRNTRVYGSAAMVVILTLVAMFWAWSKSQSIPDREKTAIKYCGEVNETFNSSASPLEGGKLTGKLFLDGANNFVLMPKKTTAMPSFRRDDNGVVASLDGYMAKNFFSTFGGWHRPLVMCREQKMLNAGEVREILMEK